MKIQIKDLLTVEMENDNAGLVTELCGMMSGQLGLQSFTPQPPMTDEYIKSINKLNDSIEIKDKMITDLKLANEKLNANIEALKLELDEAKKKLLTGDKDPKKIKPLLDTISGQKDEIASLRLKIQELQNKPGEYSSVASALAKQGLISEEEHNDALTRAAFGREVKTHYNELETNVSSYVDSPLLVTDFGKFSVVNCTPHPVNLNGPCGNIVIGPSDVVTRLEFDHKPADIDGTDLPLVVEAKGNLLSVPVRKKNTLYIVSRIVFDVAVDREDFICPNVMKAQRSSNGQVVSVPSFICKRALINKMLTEGEI